MNQRLSQLLCVAMMWLTNHPSHTLAFARQHQPIRRALGNTQTNKNQGFHVLLKTRGGSESDHATATQKDPDNSSSSSKSMLIAPILSLGKQYSAALEKAPILTKSLTACCIFALSDYLAQRLEKKKEDAPQDWTRTLTSAAVGLFCFGPAAHAWYNMIFKVFPGTGLLSTLKKAAMGQMFFGPSFTCIFFAASLLQTGQFSFSKWFNKIRCDLPGAWLAGLSFWPLVDLVSYSIIPMQFIPLFVNVCSLIWTIYLSTVANRVARTD